MKLKDYLTLLAIFGIIIGFFYNLVLYNYVGFNPAKFMNMYDFLFPWINNNLCLYLFILIISFFAMPYVVNFYQLEKTKRTLSKICIIFVLYVFFMWFYYLYLSENELLYMVGSYIFFILFSIILFWTSEDKNKVTPVTQFIVGTFLLIFISCFSGYYYAGNIVETNYFNITLKENLSNTNMKFLPMAKIA